MRLERLACRFRFLLSILLLLIISSGCGDKKVYRIGVSQCSDDDWRTKMNEEIKREMMLHDDAIVEIRSADDNSAKQIEDIRYFVDNKFDIIIAAPNEAEALTPVIKEVYEKGIPVFLFDRNINGNTYTAFQGADNQEIGKYAALNASRLTDGNARVLEIRGLKGSTPADQRHSGFFLTADSLGTVKIIGEGYGNWNEQLAAKIADSLLRVHPDANLIYAHNDRMAIEAAKVAERLGRGDIKIIGVDAAPEIGVRAVDEGVIDASFTYPTDGYRLIQTALKILKGEQYDRELLLPGSMVDYSNASSLLLQYNELVAETEKIYSLKEMVDDYWHRHSIQTMFLYAVITMLVLLFVLLFFMLKMYWAKKKQQEQLAAQNQLLEEQRDLLADQRDRLSEQRDLLEEQRDREVALNERLTEATNSKLAFFTNVSHDLRTPLTLIAEPVSQMIEAKNLTPRQQHLMHLADKNVKILGRLINQILDFRKYENDKLNLHLTEVDFRKCADDWMESFYGIARKRDITLTLKDSSRPLPIAIDVEKIERVFFNLLSNALKYTPANGKIEVGYGEKDGMLTLYVADNGNGISKDDLGMIFDRFFQVDRVHPKGSGIGLSLAKAFVELHGGSISVESELKKGSRFTVELPVKHISEIVEEVEKNIDSQTVASELETVEGEIVFENDRPLVLIIDDNRDIRELVSTILNDEYNIITASNGAEGIKKAVKYVPDVVVCDVMMPGMNGMECCRKLKEEVSTSHIPVLLLTACIQDEQRIEGYNCGADGYLSKPFSGAVLKSRIASLIANRYRIRRLWQNPAEVVKERKEKPVAQRKGELKDIDSSFYQRFLEYFSQEIGNPDLTVDSIAAKMGLERTQFYRKIKSLTNYSPVELIRTLRLKQARIIVTSTDKSISEVAYEIGFSNPAYFTKCYREVYGETPTETRQKLSEKG
ncbi:MAG: substrate-binding domain-containing protein [Muribaculaceae bacterium]|nr:substrate-binding domain-containing protein [Muribaculaceae bacterium]